VGGELKDNGTDGKTETNSRNKNEHKISVGNRYRDRQFRRSRAS